MDASVQLDATFRSPGGFGVRWLAGWPCFTGAGRDLVDLIQRLSTQDVRSVASGRSTVTLLLSPTGRLLHRVLLQPADGCVRLLAEPPSADTLLPWIDRYTFAEDVRVVAAPELTALLAVGPAARAAVGAALGTPWAGAPGDTTGAAGCVASAVALGPLAAAVVTGPAEGLAALGAELARRGAVSLDDDAWTQLRVEAGLPEAGREFTEDHHPLEAGLASDVSFTKGCYTGQEVVARQDAYGKVTRRLVGLVVDGEVQSGDAIVGATSRPCLVTTVAPCAATGDPGRTACLAYVPAAEAVEDREVALASGQSARVRLLPLPRFR